MSAKVLIILVAGSSLSFIQREDRNRWSQVTPAYAKIITFPSEAGGEPELRSLDALAGQCIASIDKNISLETKLPGISNDEARDFVAAALAKAGIPLGNDDCTKQTPPTKSLRLRLDVSTVEQHNYVAYHTTLRAMETLARQSAYRTGREVTGLDVPIWLSEELAIVRSADAALDIGSSITRVTEEFCRAFLKANQP